MACRPDRPRAVGHDECRGIKNSTEFLIVRRAHDHFRVRRGDHHARALIHIGGNSGNSLCHRNCIDMDTKYIDPF